MHWAARFQMGFENLMLKEGGYPHLPDVKALQRKITELEAQLRAAQLDAERNRGEAVLFRHVITLDAREFGSIYTRNRSGHGKMESLIEQSLRKSMEKK
jgi:hypothetical protein